MSVSSCQNEVNRHHRTIGDLRSKIADKNKRIANVMSDISSLTRNLQSASSPSSARSYLSRIESKQSEMAREQNALAGLEKHLADAMRDLGRAQENLSRAQEQEQKNQYQESKKRDAEAKRRAEDQLKLSQATTQEIKKQAAIQSHLRREALMDLSRLPEKIQVLFCASNPQDQNSLLLDEEVRAIKSQIRAAKHRDSVALEQIWAVRSIDLLQSMNEVQPHVVHFSGHGSDEDEIVFLDDKGNTKLVSKEAIVQMLATTATNLRLVVFNTCFSSSQAQEITEHVDAAIGMSDSIGDDAARNFAAQFYSAIGFGLSVQQAFDQAKAYLLAENSDEAKTPELYTRKDVDANEIILVKP